MSKYKEKPQDTSSISASTEELQKDDNKTKKISKKIEELRLLIGSMERNYLTQKKELQMNSFQPSDFNQSIGVHCIKCSNNEYVFEFPIFEQGIQIETYTIQLFNHNNRGELGKMRIPIGINVKRILEETPLDHVSNASKFLKNCKSYIDVYHERKKQYEDLKSFVNASRNCFVDSNYNYTLINLKLFEVLNKNECYNVIFYLLYDLASQRPSKIKFDSNNKKKLEKTVNDFLEKWSEYFLTLNLKEALNRIIEEKNLSLQWKLQSYNDYERKSDSSETEEETAVSKKRIIIKPLKRLNSPRKKAIIKQDNTRRKKSDLTNTTSKQNSKHIASKSLKAMRQTTLDLYSKKNASARSENKNSKLNESKTIETNKNFKNDQKSFNIKLRSRLNGKTVNHKEVSTSTPIQGHSKKILKQMKENLEISRISPKVTENSIDQQKKGKKNR